MAQVMLGHVGYPCAKP